MSIFRALPLVVAVLLTACAPLGAQSRIASPVYQNWARFRPGTRVAYTKTSEVMNTTTESRIAYELIEVTPDKVVVEMSGTTTIMGAKTEMPRTRLEYPAKVDPADPTVQSALSARASTREETLDVLGTKMICKLVETTIEQGAATIRTRTWSSDEIPGALVRSETTMEGPVITRTLVVLTERVAK